jgi:hypothetical protein
MLACRIEAHVEHVSLPSELSRDLQSIAQVRTPWPLRSMMGALRPDVRLTYCVKPLPFASCEKAR